MRLLHGEGDFVFILVAPLCGKKEVHFFFYSGETTLWRRWFLFTIREKKEKGCVVIVFGPLRGRMEVGFPFSHYDFLAKVTVGLGDVVHNRASQH